MSMRKRPPPDAPPQVAESSVASSHPGVPLPVAARFDFGGIGLLVANAVLLVQAIHNGWTLATLFWPYWLQGILIGISTLVRMRSALATQGGGQSKQTRKEQHQSMVFFAGGYAFANFGYALGFVMVSAILGTSDMLPPVQARHALLLPIVLFTASQAMTLYRQLAVDRRNPPNVDDLSLPPIMRIIPMHLTVMFGFFIAGNGADIVLFGTLKTVADLLMHTIESTALTRGAVRTNKP